MTDSNNHANANDKLTMHTNNLVDSNIEKIAELFPNCITESQNEQGELERAIDFELLKQELSHQVVDGSQERYRLDWVGKRKAILEANTPIAKTLRPMREESVNFDSTENLFIEGDNLDALKLLQESYLGKVKMIYIDPPYNIGNDKIYKDDFSENTEDFLQRSNQVDEDGNRLVANTENNGRFHSDWLTMMYSRLKLARNLLSDDGVIFISIDDNEVHNLRKLCEEIYGANNFICIFTWQNKKGGGNDSTHIAVEHEYILCFAKNKENLDAFYQSYDENYLKRYKEEDSISRFFWDTFKRKSGKQYYPIECPDGTVLEYDEDGNKISWLRSQDRFFNDLQSGEVRILKINDSWSVHFKQRLPKGKKPRSLFKTVEILDDKGTTGKGGADLFQYFNKDVFSNPKPVQLISYLMSFILTDEEDIVLDFFSGSGTTAESLLEANLKDGIGRSFILVQFPEHIEHIIEKSSGAAKIISQNAKEVLSHLKLPIKISELTKERIRRAGQKIVADNADKEGIENLDIGFRVLKVDSTNMKDVYYTPDKYSQDLVAQMQSNIKDDRTAEDLLFQVMLDWGVPLDLPITSQSIQGQSVYCVGGNSLIASFEVINAEMIDDIAKLKPLKFVSCERAIQQDQDKSNIKERFRQLSPNTDVKFI